MVSRKLNQCRERHGGVSPAGDLPGPIDTHMRRQRSAGSLRQRDIDQWRAVRCEFGSSTAVDRVNLLDAGFRGGRPARLGNQICRADLVIIDEFGYPSAEVPRMVRDSRSGPKTALRL